jgi:hypothetical protein
VKTKPLGGAAKDDPTYMRKAIVEWQDEALRNRKLAKRLLAHLDYINWGSNAFEREVSKLLRDEARKELAT